MFRGRVRQVHFIGVGGIGMSGLAEILRTLGFDVWIDEENLAIGTLDWERAIEEAIQQVDAFVVILSPAAKGSKWVRAEIRLAELHKIAIFPVLAYGDEAKAMRGIP